MRLRREPNNRSKPTHLKYFNATQRKSSSEFSEFSVLIKPDFLIDFLSESAQECESESVGSKLKTIIVS